MTATHYVFSTLANDNRYVNHHAPTNDVAVPIDVDGREGVLIKGGANVADKRFVTPRGVMTPVTDTQLDYLRANNLFPLHERNGFVRVERKPADPEKVAAEGMEGRDASAQLEEGDFKEGEAPVINEASPGKPSNSRRA